MSGERLTRPKSAVSTGVGLSGLAGLFLWFAIARQYGLSGPFAALTNVAACGIPMVLWSLLVDRVHRNPSTGIDWDSPARSLAQSLDTSLSKLAGLWATWALIACIYAISRFYWTGNYLFAMKLLIVAAPVLFVLSVPYILWIDTRLKHPHDGAWALGQWLMGSGPFDRAAIADHLRSWAVKGFYLAFMLSIVPGGFGEVVARPWAEIVSSPVAITNYLISFMFVIDVAMATVGYVLTMKPLDAHIRSATPYAEGWVAALICYPPFILMGNNGPLDYHQGTMDWSHWLGGQSVLLGIWGGVLVLLTAIYAWATVAFGLRFSNLTHRGILTHGPYAWVRHPAYLSKNAFWWLSTLPFLVTSGSTIEAARNTAIMAIVSGVYYWRAKTEEKHLGNDAAYRDYSRWMRQRWSKRVR
ncbi:isoprenylcysteine carboxylmethyltransferase family protein [Sphingomonas sp.]|uniref:methyltransferase family protein n=1 Tax=Sphingomonas sp. TaxID=28214 RepID=UPI0025EE4982|nr:isoprenylcysteine carboxylmethyltransferase family protein [Sphingomonas sp.]